MCEHHNYAYMFLNDELVAVDSCLAFLLLQLHIFGIETIESCCGHGKGYPNITCASGTKEKLRKFGCKIVITRQDGLVEAYFPVKTFRGRTYTGTTNNVVIKMSEIEALLAKEAPQLVEKLHQLYDEKTK